MLPRDQIEHLTAAIEQQDHLRRVRDAIAALHTVVFHEHARADWTRTRDSATQILVCELVSRHQGRPEEVFFVLRNLEDGGKTWDEAIRATAASIHSYFTTPLGIIMRQDVFGSEAVFITPEAEEWAHDARGRLDEPEPTR
ncbi:MAG: hypothetical protein AB1716_15170 [Planctomycetota bacterium]